MASKRNRHEEHAARARLQMFEAKQELEVIKQVRRSRDNRFALLISASTLVVVVLLQTVYFSFGPGHVVASPSSSGTSSVNPLVPSATIAEAKTWDATITLNGVSLQVSLDGAKAPQNTSNFLALANKGFFNNTTCHRLTTTGVFIIQCGDPTATGTGGPGYSFGPIENAPQIATDKKAPKNSALYKAGTIAMARQGNKGDSQGSQFFIVYKDSYFPNDTAGGYSVFGKITSGLSGLNPFISAGVVGGSADGKPVKALKISSVSLKTIPKALQRQAQPSSSTGAKK